MFQDLHRHPGLLVGELLWRWTAGALLFLLAGFAAWRVWTAALPAVRATGLFLFTPDTLLSDPAQLGSALVDSYYILEPVVARMALGLAPLFVFLWVAAFALGRTAVLARFDPRLPRRRFVLAQSEGLRIGVLFGSVLTLFAALHGASLLAFGGGRAFTLLFLAFAATAVAVYLWFTGRFRRALAIATTGRLVKGLPFFQALKHGWQLDKNYRIVPLRRAVGRVRLYLTLAGLVLGCVPAPFALGWPLVGWWVLLSLPPLAAAAAWRLGAQFVLIRALQAEQGKP